MICRNKKEKFIRFTFILPLILFFGLAVVIPFISGLNLSFTNWDSISQDYDYVMFKNYIAALKDANMRESLMRSIYFGVTYCVCSNIISLGIALLLNKECRGSKVAKTLFFIPTCLSAVLAAFIWKFLYSNYFTALFGMDSLLGQPDTALNAIVAMYIWNMVGINIIIYAASLTNIPKDYYEAATIDGANKVQQFFNVTIPLLMPAFSVCVTLSLTNAMKEFAIVLASTGGGPISSTKLILIYIFDNIFEYYKAGYGQAMAMIFFVFLVIIGTSVSGFFRRREVEY